jgi:nicotinate-nucleotide adenylyltransferase
MSWRETDKLFQLAHFVGVTRPGYQLADAELPRGAVSLVEVPALAISSTDCRDRVGRGMPVWYLVPDGVVQYIEKRGLYHGRPARPGEVLPGTGVRRQGPPASDHLPTDHLPVTAGPARPSLPDDPAPGDGTSPDFQEVPR